MNKDLLEQSGKSPMDMSFYGICVKECPQQGTYICNYDTQTDIDSSTDLPAVVLEKQQEYFNTVSNALSGYSEGPCWFVPMETESVFYRCLPKESPTRREEMRQKRVEAMEKRQAAAAAAKQ